MKQKSLFKGLVALTLSAAMLLCVTGCDDNTTVYQPSDTDLSSLSVTEPSPFYFGTKDRDVNGLVEVHDPSTFKDPNSEYYYCYSTDSTMSGNPNRGVGIQIRRSSNLTDWEYIGHALDDASVAEARVLPDGSYNTGFWAPSIAYVNGEYRLYYSVSTFGAATSRIYLAVSSSPEGPFTNRGLVVDTWKNTSGSGPNGIDPYYVEDKDGKPYLVYGSFFGGIYIKELKEDGTAVDNDTSGLLRAYYGTRLAIRETNALDGPEGASIIYNEDTGYYYLFLSYGYLGDTYDIRVARSEEITGPYVDYQGNEMTASGVVTTGTKLAASYQFTASAPGAGTASSAPATANPSMTTPPAPGILPAMYGTAPKPIRRWTTARIPGICTTSAFGSWSGWTVGPPSARKWCTPMKPPDKPCPAACWKATGKPCSLTASRMIWSTRSTANWANMKTAAAPLPSAAKRATTPTMSLTAVW